ncbi:SusC/RagA family TonB-linked outer membrane protein [Pedobacter duraquae]|uniref:TonB-linked SusC/RagA family outer membrane protein n=1 Tax=Pedobacter duraquae TaxID=425511 RepID=A0A4R6IQE0_9SPHI|nr:TonB-dependent receptor [Pedobacter duraquae]TDO24246.1 TonB-linked SusC/RagA family outer membrane protein [Pedobacter duraquae]
MKSFLHTITVCVIFLLILPFKGQAQQKTVRGTVSDASGLPIPGVSVMIKGSQQGTSTDNEGKFTLNVPSEASILQFRAIGFNTIERPANSGTINVRLAENAAALQEVVVQAFGTTQKKATVTGSVATIKGADLVSTSVSNVTNMLIGNAPGVSGLQTSGEPGRNGATIYIRGVSTFAGSRDPLVVIDGIEQASERPYDQLNSMDANEIENISILKDASSTAVYGIRGANGVIIVTTKRGKEGRPALSVSTNFGLTNATNLMHNVNSYDYAVMRNESIAVEKSTFGTSSFDGYVFTPNDLYKLKNNRDFTPAEIAAYPGLTADQRAQLANSPALYYGSRDLFAEQFGNTGAQQQFNLTVSGGSPKIRYFTSLGYFNQGSILNNTSYYGANTGSTFDRYNFRSNFDIDVAKNLLVSINLSGQFGTTSGPGYNNGANSPYDLSARYKSIMQYIFDSNPLTAPGLIDNHLINQYAALPGTDLASLLAKLGSQKGNQNAIRNLLTSGRESLYNTLLSNSITVKHTMNYITKGLSARATANYDDNYVKSVAYQLAVPEYTVRRNITNPNNIDFFGGAIGTNTFTSNAGHNSTWRKTNFQAGLDYASRFGDHSVTGLLLGTAQKYSLPSNDTFYTPSGVLGLVAKATYNYKEKYLAEFSAGYNGTEQFVEGKRFGFFPAYSAGWVVTNESFFPKNDYVTFLKLRGSFGEVGNDQVGDPRRRYLYLPSTYSLNQAGYYWGTSNGSVVNPYFSGTYEGNIGNPEVTWERAKKTNIGLEAKFFANRLSFTADVYEDKRDNILTNLSDIIPYTYGVASNSVPPANVGKVTNKGYELVLGWSDKAGEVGYFATANLNYSRNKIIYRAEAPKAYPWMNATGYSIGQKFGLLSDGFFNNQQELANRPYNKYNANQAALGDVRYKDVNGDGFIDEKDVVPVGYSNLPQYNFSLKTGLTYKGFDLSVLLTGTAKGSFSLNNYAFNTPFSQTAGNVMQYMFDGRWTADKVARGEKILYPRATMNGGTGSTTNFIASDLWTISSDFMRLKNVELGYTLPKIGFLTKAKISAIRVYANGNNLLTWNSKAMDLGLDPEATDGGGYGVYPLTRVFVFGANIRF